MNDSTLADPLPDELISEARPVATATKRRLVDVLEERLGLEPDVF
jgi:hypothetical protein